MLRYKKRRIEGLKDTGELADLNETYSVLHKTPPAPVQRRAHDSRGVKCTYAIVYKQLQVRQTISIKLVMWKPFFFLPTHKFQNR
jgi:hypothetical protein